MKKFFILILFGLFLVSCETYDPTVSTGTPNPYSSGLDKDQFIGKFFKDKDLDEIEGVYTSSDNRYEVAVIKNKSDFKSQYDYLAIITDTNTWNWKKGQVKFELKNTATPTIFTGNYFMGNKMRVGRTFFLKKGYIEVNLPTGYYGTNQPALFLKAYPSYTAKSSSEKKDKTVKASSGSAFFVDNSGHIITNYHVVKDCGNKSKIMFNGAEYPAKLIAKDKFLDLALLKTDLKNEMYINITSKPPKKLDRIIAAGYPFGKFLSDDLKFTSGIISSIKGLDDDSTRLQIDAALNMGNSGGPIVNEKSGELVAVAVSSLRKDLSESVNFGIKAGQVKVFLESNQISLNKNTTNVDLSNLLEKSTVYTFCK